MSEQLYKFWMVWRQHSPTTRYQHPTRAAALQEAKRLAKAHPGTPFYVLSATSVVVADRPEAKTFGLSYPPKLTLDDEIPF